MDNNNNRLNLNSLIKSLYTNTILSEGELSVCVSMDIL